MGSVADLAALERFAEVLGIPLPERFMSDVSLYLDRLTLWNTRLRLTGERDRTALLHHHVADALAVAARLPPGTSFADLGTGPGLPGLIVRMSRPDTRAVLIDSRRRPISFLAEVVRDLALQNVELVESRVETFGAEPSRQGRFDAVMSRGVDARRLLPLAARLLRPGGQAIVMTSLDEGIVRDLESTGWRVDAADYTLPDRTPRRLLLCTRVC
jgi:16S rRNA (guanine527-N7)-methyltransferase